ncbi:LLM class flavin-dependent oxidoreductase [Cupriavidus basilensis]|uniref:LLM class flavin-dependent oxidoreductase n=1 Tax=Cupriavidus basilensis TaxID=68895 RepID=A0ABT6B069_9BURK|nr:LLM class flavin-dependent oxidoreductase [Cupriavidus basilensis]MDF3838173.1 LLM class flavin-dependent oxidoreductase [Cupriavidus basilensis]
MSASQPKLRLSVLDQSPVIAGHTARDALAATVELAQAADGLGYTRYWCAEHHGLRGVCNPAPEVMLARLGSVTQRIRLGSGGVMLPYYSPFKVAEQFRMLEGLFPGRIDLGVGRAPGGDMRTAQAVAMGQYNRGDHFAEQVQDLSWLLRGEVPPGHIAEGVVLQPEIDTRPELWVLGSSDYGGALAARLGLRFAFAHFINPHTGHAVAQQYRNDFEPDYDERPYSAAAIFVICADSEAEAAELERAVDLRRLQMAYGVNAPIPSLSQAAQHEPTERDRLIVERERPRTICGTPEQVAQRMLALRERFLADELVVLSVTASYAARLRTYELLAQAFDLSGD